MKKTLGVSLLTATVVAVAGLANGCNSTPAPVDGPCGYTTCYTTITPAQFVTELVQLANDGKIASGYSASTIAKEVTQQPDTFIIWDSDFGHYVAIDTDQLTNALQDLTFNNGAAVNGDASFTGPLAYVNQTTPLVVVNPIGDGPDGIMQYEGSNGTIYSQDGRTKDTDLQAAQLERLETVKTAAAVSRVFKMDFTAAAQITLLSQKIQKIGPTNMTAADHQAVANTILGISGISADELNATIAAGVKGDTQSVDALVSKIADHVGMSQEQLRDQILPMLGVTGL